MGITSDHAWCHSTCRYGHTEMGISEGEKLQVYSTMTEKCDCVGFSAACHGYPVWYIWRKMASLITTGTLIKTHLEITLKRKVGISIIHLQYPTDNGGQTINWQTGEVPYLQQTLSISYTLILWGFETRGWRHNHQGKAEVIMTSLEDSNPRRNLLRVSNWLRKWLECGLMMWLPHHCYKG